MVDKIEKMFLNIAFFFFLSWYKKNQKTQGLRAFLTHFDKPFS